VKTYDLYDRSTIVLACALLPSCRRPYWRSWTSSDVLVVFVLLLEEIDHCSQTFVHVILLIFWLRASVMLVGTALLNGLSVIGIFLILIYTPY
jgi:hypothetical protein